MHIVKTYVLNFFIDVAKMRHIFALTNTNTHKT